MTLKILQKIKNCVLGAKYTKYQHLDNLEDSSKCFFGFLKCFVNDVVKTSIWISMARSCALLSN